MRLQGGGTRERSNIWFSGFGSQEDGASFESRYSHVRGADDTVALRNLARWLYRQLRDAREAGTSDPAVDEALAVNSFTFTGDGKRFG